MVKRLILGLIILIVLMIAYNLASQIREATRSQERLSQSADQLFQLEAKNKALKAKLAQVKSDEFVEKEARDQLGLSKAGDTVVVIPEEKLKSVLGTSSSAQMRLPNWLGWLKVFFR